MEVKAINEYGVELYLHGSESDNWEEEIENCQGIELSPEILDKCGFEIGGYDMLFWSKGNFELAGLNWADAGIEEYQFVNFRWNDGKDGILQIHYLHQLQNLYFTLTGEELQINL